MEEKVTYRCSRCGHRLFDMVEGSFVLEMKCEKCKRILRICSGTQDSDERRKPTLPSAV